MERDNKINLFFFSSHWKHIILIIESFKNETPLRIFLKRYFDINKSCGKKDRYAIKVGSYAYYRFNSIYPNSHIELKQQIFISLYLKNILVKEFEAYFPFCNDYINSDFEEKIIQLKKFYNLSFDKSLSIKNLISQEVSIESYHRSFFYQQFFFINIIRNKEKIIELISNNNIQFKVLDSSTISFKSNEIDVQKILLNFKTNYYIQDYACRQILNFLDLSKHKILWDCCCGSGGKTILLKSLYPELKIWCSDVRDSILINLKKRLGLYSIEVEKIFKIDLNKPVKNKLPIFDAILADVPCTGSGTWHSTPENKFFFNPCKIKKYYSIQRDIVEHSIKFLRKNGILIYITCSIFKGENEDQLQFFQKRYSLVTIQKQYIHSYEYNSDIIFLGVLKRMH